ncbi:hypothetical protein BKX96_03250 [Pseudomonas putida]|nr:hypothetical protein BKX96_03250 [Pseudomonas putida]
MTLAMLVIMAETTGNCLAIGKLTGKPTTPQTLGNAFRADGLSTMLGGLFNRFPYNAFTQNTGLIALSNVKSRFVVAAAGATILLNVLLNNEKKSTDSVDVSAVEWVD